MRKFRFYNERTNLRIGSSVLLTKEEAIHVRRVLRLKRDDIVYIFNGQKEYEARLKLVTNDATMAEITKEISNNPLPERTITAFLSLIKLPSFELAIQKLTELGVDAIIPLQTEYSVIKIDEKVEKKIGRWKKIIVEACKQCNRVTVPDFQQPVNLKDVTAETLKAFDAKLIFSTQQHENFTDLSKLNLNSKKNIAFFIGPEGGFSPFEESQAEAIGLSFTSLGSTILKSETAAIAAMAIVKYLSREE